MPLPHEWIYKEEIPRERHKTNKGAVRILEVDCTILYVITAPEKELSLPVEFEGLTWLVDSIGSFKILSGSLTKLGIGCVYYFMKVVYLSELTHRQSSQHGSAACHLLSHSIFILYLANHVVNLINID